MAVVGEDNTGAIGKEAVIRFDDTAAESNVCGGRSGILSGRGDGQSDTFWFTEGGRESDFMLGNSGIYLLALLDNASPVGIFLSGVLPGSDGFKDTAVEEVFDIPSRGTVSCFTLSTMLTLELRFS